MKPGIIFTYVGLIAITVGFFLSKGKSGPDRPLYPSQTVLFSFFRAGGT
jgi:hypothetical protein